MNGFEKTIKAFLDKKASGDADFKAKYEAGQKEKKDITACCNYIIGEVRKTGRQGFDDDEIYNLAMHFYDEADIKAPEKDEQKGVKVVVNTKIELTAADKKRIEAEARKKVEDEERAKAEKKIRDEQERQRKREEEKKRLERENADSKTNREYRKRYGAALGIVVRKGDIEITPLQNVQDFFEQGKELEQCVYGASYYKHTDSILLCARIAGVRTETVEVFLKERRIGQCRGYRNQDSKRHAEILSLAQKNMNKFINAIPKMAAKPQSAAV